MKKTVMILALAMFSIANAQKGTVLVMGTIGFTNQNEKSTTSKSNYDVITFLPKVGYQLDSNWTVGVESSIESSKSTYLNGEGKVSNFSVGSFIRYAKPLGGVFSTYVDLGAGFQNAKRTTSIEGNLSQVASSTIVKNDGFYIGLTPSLFVNINKGFGLNINVGGLKYVSIKEKGDSSSEYKTFTFNFGKAFSVGLSKNF